MKFAILNVGTHEGQVPCNVPRRRLVVEIMLWGLYTCSVFWPFFSVEFLVELDVTLTGLFSICAWFLFPVLLCWGEFCCVAVRCVALHCVVIHYVVLRCTVLRSVVSLLCCICWVVLHCIVLHCDPWRCVALCCVALLTSSAFLVFHVC